MGAYWLRDLPDVADAAGLNVRTWQGWESRSRSSGGYTQVWAVFAHHTASNTAPNNDAAYMWDNATDRPIGAILLERDGRVTIGAAGATNCQGKGGAHATSHGTIPADTGNTYGIAVEACNAGTGEIWPTAQTDAYVILCAALCDAYGLDPNRDVIAHFEWAPDRKIDPAGPSPWATGTASWNMGRFRDDITGCTTTPPNGDDEVTDDDIERIADAVWNKQFNAPGVAAADNPQPAGWLLAQGYGRTVEGRDYAKQAVENTS